MDEVSAGDAEDKAREGSEIRGHYTLSTRLSMNNATRNWEPGNGEISGMKISNYYILGLLLVVDRE